ncbi:MFS transporter [Amycolatopsis anabasis]|uniref:MFS transporter n=1 Tax=Amycolatopsis anabasis TaxID=1840409 RepID=UPI001FEAB75D|nr:MFS transporter [Amycolatopsis anabasis]
MHTIYARSALARELAFAAVLLGMFVAQLDGTVVVAALPALAADLHAGTAIIGVSTAYLLTVTVSTPIHGRLGDLHGRRVMFVFSVSVFAAGSAACAAAPDIGVLIAARAVQGIGGSGLIVTAMSALGELFAKDELIRRQGWQTALFAVSSLGGPPVGGLLAGGPGWRWIFLLNLPVCLLALALGVRGLPGRNADRPRERFDLRGSLLIAVTGTIVVALGSVESLGRSPLWTPLLLVLAVAAGAGFVAVQRRSSSPLLAPKVFADHVVARSVLVSLLAGVALYGTFTFVSLVVDLGSAGGSARTGLLLTVLMGGQLVVSTSFAVLARRWPRMVPWGRLGCALGAAGLVLIALTPWAGTGPLIPGLLLFGASFGLCTSAYPLLGQARARRELLGVTMGAFVFARQAGGVLGTAVFGWVALLATGGFGPAGLTVVFAAAAVAMLGAWLSSPRASSEAVTHSAAVSSPR